MTLTEELLKTLPLVRREHPLTAAEALCPCCGRPRKKIGEQTSQQLEYMVHPPNACFVS
jgi:transposase